MRVARSSLAFYLVTTLLYGGGEFAHYHIYTLQCGLLQLLDLLFHYSLKGQVRGEQPRPVGIGRRHGRGEEDRKNKQTNKKKPKETEKGGDRGGVKAPNEDIKEQTDREKVMMWDKQNEWKQMARERDNTDEEGKVFEMEQKKQQIEDLKKKM